MDAGASPTATGTGPSNRGARAWRRAVLALLIVLGLLLSGCGYSVPSDMSDDEGHLTINFVPTAKADDRSAFPLIAAKVVNDYKAPPRPMYPPGEFEGDELVEDSLNDSGDGDPGVEGSGVETTSNP